MKLYRFSPIENQEELFEAIQHLHFFCNQLCKQSLGRYLPNAGNVGIFCHYDDEHEQLTEIRKKITRPSDNPDQKYFPLLDPIVIPKRKGIPQTIYTHLYIRRPDPYRYQVGDIDFNLDQNEYQKLKSSILAGGRIRGARVFERKDLDMIELYDPNVDALAYVNTYEMSQMVHFKLSNATKL